MDRAVRGHAVSPEKVADRILYGIRHNRYLVYTSADIRALYLFKRTLWWPYSVAMRVANYAFTNALRRIPADGFGVIAAGLLTPPTVKWRDRLRSLVAGL